jgi:hypothetical protein
MIMIMTTLLPSKNLFTKNIMDSIKLSTHLFQGRLRDSGSKTCKIGRLSGSKTCKIGRLDGTYVITRSTLFSKET